MRAILFVCVSVAVALASAAGSDVLILDPSNFDSEIGGDKPALVEFFAPWCGHCKSLAPEYEILATTFKGQAIKIASVDADKHRDLGTRFGVTGFPTIKWFPAGSKEGEAYSAGRTAPDMTDWINKKVGTSVRIKSAPTAVTVLDSSNFDAIVLDATKDVLVEFYAPWCGHCKSLTPKYEKVAQTFDGEDSVVVAKVDADAHKELGSRFGVTGFPTIKWFGKGNKAGTEYSGGREVDDFVKFINTNAGTERTVGGGFGEKAGRIPELDALVPKFDDASDEPSKKSVIDEMSAIIRSLPAAQIDFGRVYEATAKRVLETGPQYATTESARLKRMIEGGSIGAKKRADFAKRRNIVRLFEDDA